MYWIGHFFSYILVSFSLFWIQHVGVHSVHFTRFATQVWCSIFYIFYVVISCNTRRVFRPGEATETDVTPSPPHALSSPNTWLGPDSEHSILHKTTRPHGRRACANLILGGGFITFWPLVCGYLTEVLPCLKTVASNGLVQFF